MLENRHWMKVVLFWCAAFVPLLILLEVASYLALTNSIPWRIRGRLGRGTVEAYLTERAKAETRKPEFIRCEAFFQNRQDSADTRFLMFHPVLGWDYLPELVYRDIDGVTYHHDSDGARHTSASFRTSAVVTYGDSFTYCSNVNDDQTWQTYLANKLGSNVLNFGVAGYGPDQAYLKYKLSDGHGAKVVVLGILPENINRVVNIFRPFYNHDDRWSLTKPLFVKEGSAFRLVPNPLQTYADTAKLADPEFVKNLGKLDYWYQFDQRLPGMTFPYLVSLYEWRKPLTSQIALASHRLLSLPGPVHYTWSLYDEDGPFETMCHVVDLFVATAVSRGALPIVVMMPHKDYVKEVVDYGAGRAERLVRYMKQKDYPHIDPIRIIAERRPTKAQLETWYAEHATAEGNKLLSDIIYTYLAEHYPHVVESKGTPPLLESESKWPAQHVAGTSR